MWQLMHDGNLPGGLVQSVMELMENVGLFLRNKCGTLPHVHRCSVICPENQQVGLYNSGHCF